MTEPNLSIQGTSTTTITAPTSISITQTRTTIYTPTSVTCLSTATTFAAYPAFPGLDAGTGTNNLAVREARPQITIPPVLPTGCPTVTIIPPSVSNEPCTRLEGDFEVTSIDWQDEHDHNHYKRNLNRNHNACINPDYSRDVDPAHANQLQRYLLLQPPSIPPHLPAALVLNYSLLGLNYYQYLNGYNYNTDDTGLGGGGYSTSHWNGNLSYYTSGLARNINFESPSWPTGPALCQLPGQASQTDCSQWTVVFQGFIFARVAGNYTVHSPIATESANWQDNSGFWWGGEKAYTDYADGNVDGAATPLDIPAVTNYFEYVLEAGEFLPFTFIYNNGQGPAANRVDITGPDGVRYPDELDLLVPPCDDSAFVP
ncbi:hypothetical protein BDW75DRAFT_236392 [Aspergillus navahoensis]